MAKGTYLQQAIECADRAEYLVVEGPSEIEQAKVWSTLAVVYATLAAAPSFPRRTRAEYPGVND